MLNTKSKGTINPETKKKSLIGRWLTHKKESNQDDSQPNGKILERNVHVTLEMTERVDGKAQTSLEHYRVLAVNTKSYSTTNGCYATLGSRAGLRLWQRGSAVCCFK
jgi:hypothetical protein